MKALVRTAAVLLLVAPFPVSWLMAPDVDATIPRPTTIDRIRDSGVLRFAATTGSLTYFFHRGAPAGFEHDLLDGFASDLGVRLAPVIAQSPGEAAELLLSGAADVAVLPHGERRLEGALRTVRYLKHGTRSLEVRSGLPATGGLFVREESRRLLTRLNGYLRGAGRDGTLKLLYERYFGSDRYQVAKRLRLSRFDTMIARHATAEGLDWRLVSAVISYESRFDAAAVSPKGATGLMQLMPSVAEAAAVKDLSDPHDNVRAGVRYLKRLMKMFPDGKNGPNLPVVLAAYLMGPGHVFDARQLARERGLDPERWAGGLDQVLPLLEDPAHYERTRFGYAKGTLAVRYVEQVLARYELYKEHLGKSLPTESARAPRPKRPAVEASNPAEYRRVGRPVERKA